MHIREYPRFLFFMEGGTFFCSVFAVYYIMVMYWHLAWEHDSHSILPTRQENESQKHTLLESLNGLFSVEREKSLMSCF